MVNRNDPEFERGLRVRLAILCLLTLAAAWFSIGFHHLDEYAMVTEFASTKLGLTDASTLSWEHPARIRPWLQPGIQVVIAKVLSFLGAANPFHWVFGARLFAGGLTILALVLAAREWIPGWFSTTAGRLRAVDVFFFTAWVPYLAVRPSSEMGAAAFLLLALVFLHRSSAKGFALAPLCAAGFLLGIAFEFRFQTGAVGLGVGLWVLFKGGFRAFLLFSAAMLPALAGGVLVDRWGYGVWTLAAWNYFDWNLLRGVAGTMGKSPFWAYPVLTPNGPLAPWIAAVMAGMFLFWLRFPLHPFAWASFPFFLMHSAIAHKEGRFLYPLAWLALLMALGLFSKNLRSLRSIESFPVARLHAAVDLALGALAKAPLRFALPLLFVANGILLAFFALSPARSEIAAQKALYQAHRSGAVTMTIWGSPYANIGEGGMYFYRPAGQVLVEAGHDAAVWKRTLEANVDREVIVCLSEAKPPELDGLAGERLRKAEVIHRTFPEWVTRNNAARWQDRTTQFTILRAPALR